MFIPDRRISQSLTDVYSNPTQWASFLRVGVRSQREGEDGQVGKVWTEGMRTSDYLRHGRRIGVTPGSMLAFSLPQHIDFPSVLTLVNRQEIAGFNVGLR